jgi:hypothetical protein
MPSFISGLFPFGRRNPLSTDGMAHPPCAIRVHYVLLGGIALFSHYQLEENAVWYSVGLGVAGASYLWSIIDAPLSASRINRERERAYGHLLEFSSDKQVIGFDLATNGKTIGAKLSMHF